MKKVADFLKTTALGGLLVLLPFLLLVMFLTEVMGLLVALATPIADLLFPPGELEKLNSPVLIAVALLVGASFLVGLAWRAALGRRVGRWIERAVLERLPAYAAFKNLTRGFVNTDENAAFKPALLITTEGDRVFIYVVEDLGGDRLTVLVPWAPTAFSGIVKIVDRSRVEMLDANIGEVSKVLSYWGVGAEAVLERTDAQK
jgi:uncharacterized membrane protein